MKVCHRNLTEIDQIIQNVEQTTKDMTVYVTGFFSSDHHSEKHIIKQDN